MNSPLNKFRGWLHRKSSLIFDQPYLTGRLILYALVLALLDPLLIALRQSPLYWSDFSAAQSELPLAQSLLQAHPLALLGAALVYLLLAWALTGLLTRSLALIAWLALVMVHASRIAAHLAHLFGQGEALEVLLLAALALLSGLVLVTGLLRSAQERAAAARASLFTRVPRLPRQVYAALGVAVMAVLITGGLWLANLSASGWQMLKPAHSPGSRASASTSYDGQRKQVLFFGGGKQWLGTKYEMTNDLWAWTGDDWQELPSETRPPARISAGMAYDEARGVTVLFGGEGVMGRLNDTWEWDGQTWKEIVPPGERPMARSGHRLFYDPARQQVVLTNGYQDADKSISNFLDDAWAWDGQQWTRITGTEPNPVQAGFSVAYEPLSQALYAFNHEGLLLWQDGRWTRIFDEPQPVGRADTGMTAAPDGSLVLFGGTHDSDHLEDTWIYKDHAWKAFSSLQRPGARFYHALFYDPISGRVILYGGYGVNQVLGDTWALKVGK